MHKTKQNKNIGVICSQSTWTKYYVIRVNERERQTKHSCNGAPRRWVINLTARAQTTTELHSRWAFSILSSKKCQAAVSNNCCNPGDDKRRGRKPKHLSHLVLTPSLNTHQFLLLVAFPFMRACTHTHTLYMCRSVTRIRRDPKQNPVVHLSGSPQSEPFSGYIRIGGGALPQQRNGTRAASSLERSLPPQKKKIQGNKKRKKRKEVGLRVSPGGSEAAQSPRSTDQRSVRALISGFYVVKMLHLHCHVFSCSLLSAQSLRRADLREVISQ